MWGIFIHIKTDPKDLGQAWPGTAWHGKAWHGKAWQGKDSFNNLTDSELLSMSRETERTIPGAIIRKDKKNENLKVSDYRRSTPSNAQRTNGKSI